MRSKNRPKIEKSIKVASWPPVVPEAFFGSGPTGKVPETAPKSRFWTLFFRLTRAIPEDLAKIGVQIYPEKKGIGRPRSVPLRFDFGDKSENRQNRVSDGPQKQVKNRYFYKDQKTPKN